MIHLCRTITLTCQRKFWRSILSSTQFGRWLLLPTLTIQVWLQMFKIGVMHGAHYIVKVDDDQCPDIKAIKKAIMDAKDPKYAYIGDWLRGRAVRIDTTLRIGV